MLAIVVLAAWVFAGRTFLWCAAMGQAMDSCCCEQAREPKPSPTLEPRGCCESKTLAKSDDTRSSDTAVHFAVPGAPYVALEAAPRTVVGCAAEAPAIRKRASVPGHPRGPPHRLNCVYLI